MQFFNTSPDDYTVIFTAGCTGALKLVTECFDYHGNSSSSCHSNSVHNEVSSVKDTAKISGESAETEKHICDESHGDKQNKKGRSGENQFSCHGNGDVNENGDSNSKKGSFIYLLDNHTSVQGMREPAFTRAGRVTCVDCDEDGIISKEHVLYQTAQYRTDGNSLFAYPAQSNFSGQKYPMEWISEVQNGRLGRMTLGEGRCYVLLDAACLVSTSPLDLGCYKPDFVTLSFYKMFGYPTGLGIFLLA